MGCIKKLFRDNGWLKEVKKLKTGGTPEISMNELKYSIQKAKSRKAVGADGVLVDNLKFLTLKWQGKAIGNNK